VEISEEVIKKIESLSDLAPLHNPAAVQVIRLVQELFPGVPQVAVFDTAFHRSLPPQAYLYAIPYEYYQRDRVRRYGFHGTSHQYVTMEAAGRISRDLKNTQFISAHLGNGCSATAVQGGRSVDTTMGLSPMEGLVMGTRSGDVDPTLHEFLYRKDKLGISDITEMLTRKSGLLGVSGVSHDMRSVQEAANQGNPRAQLAVELFCYRLARSISGLTASLTALDAIIFTGGIGENSSLVRAKTIQSLTMLKADLDPELNQQHGKQSNGRITKPTGTLCLVIPTNEELMISREVTRLIQ
ncbi:MAG: acetate/propionate family kinase, partial [Verrucomicrobia bacterium]|nr:acetate/propionate family kinase [Verrucomicrobiota bacterium]